MTSSERGALAWRRRRVESATIRAARLGSASLGSRALAPAQGGVVVVGSSGLVVAAHRASRSSMTSTTCGNSGCPGSSPVIVSASASAGAPLASSACSSTLSASSSTSKRSAAPTALSRSHASSPRSASSAAGPMKRSWRLSLRSGLRPTRSQVSGRSRVRDALERLLDVRLLLVGGEAVLRDEQRLGLGEHRANLGLQLGRRERLADRHPAAVDAVVRGGRVRGVDGEELALDERLEVVHPGDAVDVRLGAAEGRAVDDPLEERLDRDIEPAGLLGHDAVDRAVREDRVVGAGRACAPRPASRSVPPIAFSHAITTRGSASRAGGEALRDAPGRRTAGCARRPRSSRCRPPRSRRRRHPRAYVELMAR